MPAGERPTFHEIRVLGAWLYEQQKFPQEYIQALMGHSDEKMTKHYQEGHEENRVRRSKRRIGSVAPPIAGGFHYGQPPFFDDFFHQDDRTSSQDFS
ncbi:tyrosine-type recombinase/integrase [Pseudomonas sp.]|uniref:tyrosine-type recombinase/integrase n=1 Tax=unclassified Pseudomonas TaxID=196821 RepID=UPI00343DB422